MNGVCSSALAAHAALSRRRGQSEELLRKVREEFSKRARLTGCRLCVFCAGSLARREVGLKSDLDVFVTTDDDVALTKRLFEYTVIAELIDVNRVLNLPEFSNDGQFLKLHSVRTLIDKTGAPSDDSENQFTTRMLLLLESESLLHFEVYERHRRAVVENYYRDKRGKTSFRPLFLLNDLLRYWRTLCLNYEERRHDPEKPWRKKNVNLKFSRMVTVFGTVLPLILKPISTADEMLALCGLTPLERLASALDTINDSRLNAQWPDILDLYEEFLNWKEQDDVELALRGSDAHRRVGERAQQLSAFLFSALTHEQIQVEFRRYLIL